MKKLTGMLFLLGLFGTASAEDIWEACNNCSATQQRTAAIRAVPPQTAGIFSVYVMDFERVSLQKYRVSVFFALRDGGYQSVAFAQETEAHLVYEFQQAVNGMKDAVTAMQDGIDVPPDVVPTAFDIIHSANMQQRVSNYINENMSLWQTIAAPVSLPLKILGKVVDLNLNILVTFSDGSTAAFVLTGIDGSLFAVHYKFELDRDSARDSDGNLIPADASQAAPFSGVFTTDANAEALVDFIQHWYSEGGDTPSIVCYSEDEAGGVIVTCKRR